MASPLIDAATLLRSLSEPVPPVVLDVRWRLGGPPGVDSYREGHIPGAIFVDLDHDLSGPPGPGGRHPLPSPGAFEAAMRAAGVSAGRRVVAYDDGDGLPAARAWWDLRYFGHEFVRVLDGGFRAWTAAGHPVTAATEPAVRGDFTARPGGMPVLDAPAAAALAADGLLLDVRAPERYRGEAEPIDAVAGHVPGAVNFPIAETANPDGTYKSPAAIAALSAAAPSAPLATDTLAPPLVPSTALATGVYCGSGVTAARGVLALELAGVRAALYVGSWSNWIADPSRPIATGDAQAHP